MPSYPMQHVVLFSFPDPLPDATTLSEMVRGLPRRISGIRRCHVGQDVSGRAHGYQWALVMEFESAEALAEYGPHPVHQELVRWLRERQADVLAFDFALTPESVVSPNDRGQ